MAAKTWILTGSLDNFRATWDHGFGLIGVKEGRRGMAEQIEPGDRIVFYVTGLRTVSEADSELLESRIRAAAGAPSAA